MRPYDLKNRRQLEGSSGSSQSIARMTIGGAVDTSRAASVKAAQLGSGETERLSRSAFDQLRALWSTGSIGALLAAAPPLPIHAYVKKTAGKAVLRSNNLAKTRGAIRLPPLRLSRRSHEPATGANL
jgi:hypothetical protein